MSQDSRPGTSSTDGSENRLVSPSPSIRKISHQRVNPHESSRLLPSRGIEYRSVYEGENQPLNIGKSSEMQNSGSIQYYEGSFHFGDEEEPDQEHSGEDQTSFSKIPGGMGISGPSQHPSEYRPVTDEDSDSMSWGELLPYYLPILSWVNHYSLPFFLGDLLGGLSLVFFQLPLSISYATSLAHVPVICGLMSLGVAPLIYLIFGSVPQMITGPESAISLIVGQAVEPILHHNKTDINPVDLVVAMTFISGATLLGFGLGRFGFLDNVLSGSLLKGFISGVGIVMAINSLVSMLGLTKLMNLISNDPTDMDIHSPFDKFMFLIHHYDRYEPLTFKISFASFTFLMSVSIFKSYCSKRNFRFSDKLIYIPEILIMVIITSCLCYKFDWHANGIEVVGSVSQEGGTFSIYNPLSINQFRLMKKVGTSGFLCAMLGFFESTTASKSLGTTFNLPISSNRELVALGFINVVGSMFGALPAFGGYGRSKINAISAKTTFSGALMGIFTIFTIAFLSEGLYYIPKCILSVITAKIGLSLMDEAPYELMFHWRSRGYNELITFFVTVVTTIFFSMEAGIAVGLVYSLIRVIKNSTLSRIQILGRIPGTNTFVDADINDRLLKMGEHTEESHNGNMRDRKLGKSQLNLFTDDYFTSVNMNVLEEIEGCLIVKIPEPLTFTNTNDLRTRLKRVELYGSTKAHPAMKRSRDESMTKYVIFDLRGMSELDSSAAQILKELIINYQNRKIISLFVRVAKNLQVRERLFRTGIISLLIENLDALGYYKAKQEVLQKKPKDNSSDFLFEQETASGIANLVEAKDVPFFEHISDALKVIDYYESSNQVGEYSVV